MSELDIHTHGAVPWEEPSYSGTFASVGVLSQPVFIGGTGRSGTTLMGSILGSHPDAYFPVHELKVHVEEGGLRSLITRLEETFDPKAHHFAVRDFLLFCWALRGPQVTAVHSDRPSWIQQVSSTSPGIHVIGPSLGLDNYDAAVARLLDEVCQEVDPNGIVDTEGPLAPFYFTRKSDPNELVEIGRRFLEKLLSEGVQRREKVIWVDDTPRNIAYAGFLLRLFPKARFIHMVRRPADVVASYLRQVWSSKSVDVVSQGLLRDYETLRIAEHQLPSRQVITVRLEDLCRCPRGELTRILSFLSMDPAYVDAMAKKVRPDAMTPATDSLSSRELDHIMELFRSASERWGYSTSANGR